MAGVGEGKMTKAWRYATGGHVWGVAVSQSGDVVYCGSGDKGIYCFDGAGKLVWRFDTGGPVFRVAASASGEIVAAGSKDGNVYVLDRRGLLLWSSPTGGSVLSVAVVPDGSLILAGSTDKYVYAFDREGTLLWRCDMKSPVRAVALSDDQDIIVISSYNNLLTCLNKWGEYQWHIESGRYPYRTAVSPDGAYILAGSEDRTVTLLDRTGKVLWQYATDGAVTGLAFTPDGQSVLAGSEDMTLYMLDLHGKPLWTMDLSSEIASVAVGAGAQRIVVGTMDSHVTLLELLPAESLRLEELEDELARAKSAGVAVSEVEYLLQSSKLLMSVGDRRKSGEQLEMARRELERARERHRKLSQPVVNYSDSIHKALEALERSMGGIKKEISEVRFDRALQLHRGAADQLRSLERLLTGVLEQHERVASVCGDFESMIRDVQAEGIEVREAERLLAAALAAIKLGDYASAVQSLRETEASIISKRTQFREAMEIVGPVRAQMKNAERYIDISDAKKLLDEAERAMNANDAERARECASLIMDVIEKVKEEASPSLSLRAGSSEGLTVNRSKFNLSITNIGKAHASDVRPEVIGPIKEFSTSPQKIDFLKAGEKAVVSVEVTADEHDIPLDAYLTVRLSFKRALDGREGRAQERARVIIGPMIEDVFLMYRDGRLITHNTRRLRPDVDGDILSGMLTAVTAFVKESFREADTEELNELRYGKTKILIERGEYICLAVVVSGVASPKMRDKMKETVRRIGQTYAEVLENWDGSVSKLKDINQMIEQLIASTYT
ncbi:MAG: outer membrane protein assembly factor BamB family protein [Thermoplasmatota archaeon]